VLEDGGIRREVVCECGQVMMSLGRQQYHVNAWAARERRSSRERWRRSRALLFSVAGQRRWRSHIGPHARRTEGSDDQRHAGQVPGGR
jgi:hypothetical protein